MSQAAISELATKPCVPCNGGTPPLKGAALRSMAEELGRDWHVIHEHHLEKEFTFHNFREAFDFTNRIGEVAEQENHHPDIYLAWGKVKVVLWTHKIDALTESDFVLAAKIEELAEK